MDKINSIKILCPCPIKVTFYHMSFRLARERERERAAVSTSITFKIIFIAFAYFIRTPIRLSGQKVGAIVKMKVGSLDSVLESNYNTSKVIKW